MSASLQRNELTALIRLQTLPKLGAITLYKVLASLDSANISPAACLEFSPPEMATRLGEPFRWIPDALAVQDPIPATTWAEKLSADGWQLIPHTHVDYPVSLRRILGDKCPPLLYIKGHIPLLHAGGIAFSGSRNVSERGLTAAANLARQATEHGKTIISGHAKGVDQTAHFAALDSGGETIFVPSEGALRFRLRADFRPFTESNPQSWVIASQFAPMEGWHVGNAMGRNRTLIGLSQALFIIEAGLDGGTWDAALEAERLHHPLYVLTDPDPNSGNSAILKRGKAKPITTEGDFPDVEAHSPPNTPPHQLSLF